MTQEQFDVRLKRAEKCFLADGTEVERKLSECHIAIPQGERSTPVLLGRRVTKHFGRDNARRAWFGLEPFTRQLQPMRMLLV
jgi:hypothetical protein